MLCSAKTLATTIMFFSVMNDERYFIENTVIIVINLGDNNYVYITDVNNPVFITGTGNAYI